MGMRNAPCRHMTVVKTTALTDCIDSAPLAMAYVPMQRWERTYDLDVALDRGTIFPELDLPFCAKR